MAILRAYSPVLHFDDDEGNPLAGGWLCTYLAGTSTPEATYADSTGTLNDVQIELDGRGECEVWIDSSKKYKFVVLDHNKDGSHPVIVKDNVSVPAGGGGGSSTPVVVDGTENEIDVNENEVSGVKHFIVSLAETVKNALSSLANDVSDINGKIPYGASSSNKLTTAQDLASISEVIPSGASSSNKLATGNDVANSIGKVKDGGSLTDGATVSVPNNSVSTLSSSQSSITLNVELEAGEIPNFAVEITAGAAITLTVTKTVGSTPTTLKYSASAGNELESGKFYQVTCVGSCWTLAEFVVPTP